MENREEIVYNDAGAYGVRQPRLQRQGKRFLNSRYFTQRFSVFVSLIDMVILKSLL